MYVIQILIELFFEYFHKKLTPQTLKRVLTPLIGMMAWGFLVGISPPIIGAQNMQVHHIISRRRIVAGVVRIKVIECDQ